MARKGCLSLLLDVAVRKEDSDLRAAVTDAACTLADLVEDPALVSVAVRALVVVGTSQRADTASKAALTLTQILEDERHAVHVYETRHLLNFLVRMLSSADGEVVRAAASTVAKLSGGVNGCDSVLASGATAALLAASGVSYMDTQAHVSLALQLLSESEDGRSELRRRDCMPALLALCASRLSEAKVRAAGAIVNVFRAAAQQISAQQQQQLGSFFSIPGGAGGGASASSSAAGSFPSPGPGYGFASASAASFAVPPASPANFSLRAAASIQGLQLHGLAPGLKDLIAAMASKEASVQLSACRAVSVLAALPSNRPLLIASGLIARLSELGRSSLEPVLMVGLEMARHVMLDDSAVIDPSSEFVEALYRFLESPQQAVRHHAIALVAAFASSDVHSRLRQRLAEHGLLPMLLAHCKASHEATVEASAMVIAALAKHPENRIGIAQTGLLSSLSALLLSVSDSVG